MPEYPEDPEYNDSIDDSDTDLPPPPPILHRTIGAQYSEHAGALNEAHQRVEQNNDLNAEQRATAHHLLNELVRLGVYTTTDVHQFQEMLDAIAPAPGSNLGMEQ